MTMANITDNPAAADSGDVVNGFPAFLFNKSTIAPKMNGTATLSSYNRIIRKNIESEYLAIIDQVNLPSKLPRVKLLLQLAF